MEIVMMGCGGGRHQTLNQTFKTGGFRINSDINMHVDPGPGALLLTTQLGLDPTDLDVVFVSHSHTDHQSDTEVMLEAANRDPHGKGRYIGSESAVFGSEKISPAVSSHHRKKVGKAVAMEANDKYEYNEVELEATQTRHSDPTGIGLKIKTDLGVIGYTSDTEYFDELPIVFEDSRILVVNVTRPNDKRIDGHLCTDDLIKILNRVEPELAMISHMGMLFLRNTPTDQASYVEKETGVKTIPAMLGTKIDVKPNDLNIGNKKRQSDLDRYS